MSDTPQDPDDIDLPGAVGRLAYLTENYVPDAVWTVGGAFRYDRELIALAKYLGAFLKVRQITNVMGAPPCLWSLDWFVQRRPLPVERITARLQEYGRLNMGVHLVFDNPFLTDADAEDPYGLSLVQALAENNANRRNAITVASDKLRDKIHSLWPKCPVMCHVNRLVTEQGRRSAQLYNRLLQSGYARVCMHPADAAKPALLDGLLAPQRMDAVVNDPCLRTCPVRKDHLRVLAEMRRNTYDVRLMERRASLIARAECQKPDPTARRQLASCNLTHNEIRALYNRGIRHFLIQSQQFRNEMTLLCDIFDCMLDQDPAISNKAALIATNSMVHLKPERNQIPTGLGEFSFSTYE